VLRFTISKAIELELCMRVPFPERRRMQLGMREVLKFVAEGYCPKALMRRKREERLLTGCSSCLCRLSSPPVPVIHFLLELQDRQSRNSFEAEGLTSDSDALRCV
jgi:hypothetical protein